MAGQASEREGVQHTQVTITGLEQAKCTMFKKVKSLAPGGALPVLTKPLWLPPPLPPVLACPVCLSGRHSSANFPPTQPALLELWAHWRRVPSLQGSAFPERCNEHTQCSRTWTICDTETPQGGYRVQKWRGLSQVIMTFKLGTDLRREVF